MENQYTYYTPEQDENNQNAGGPDLKEPRKKNKKGAPKWLRQPASAWCSAGGKRGIPDQQHRCGKDYRHFGQRQKGKADGYRGQHQAYHVSG